MERFKDYILKNNVKVGRGMWLRAGVHVEFLHELDDKPGYSEVCLKDTNLSNLFRFSVPTAYLQPYDSDLSLNAGSDR